MAPACSSSCTLLLSSQVSVNLLLGVCLSAVSPKMAEVPTLLLSDPGDCDPKVKIQPLPCAAFVASNLRDWFRVLSSVLSPPMSRCCLISSSLILLTNA